ncbi:DUF1642 domain-containing protein [Pediococcus pentosaceus]|uniref:DUF1642 domain-containing protein n=1 Tax=Pediococcus pentosaceus TaxID=1255 RepID=UPI0003C339D7|nr:DUF1642 domain-containing protein [Pediococcus pentosaceus]AHA04713.1 hypothetical protein T256_02525 [Pediococcus pentosaceus SL4]
MTKDEYVKTLEKRIADEESNIIHDNYCDGYVDGLKKAIVLSKQLDEPKKVVIPQFVADWIEEEKLYYGNEVDPLGIIDLMGNYIASKDSRYEWLKNIDNQKLLLNAIANGYEVEKEPKYLVKIKGICQENQWLDYEVVGDKRYFEINSESEKYKTYFTKQWLKDNWPEYEAYNNAGLLEFEEVEDD